MSIPWIWQLLLTIHLALDLAKPLNDLLKKDNKFEWTSDCQKAFHELKKCFTEEPVLIILNHSKLKQMPPNMLQEQFLPNLIQMAIDIPFHLFQKPSLQLKETMKFTIKNYWR